MHARAIEGCARPDRRAPAERASARLATARLTAVCRLTVRAVTTIEHHVARARRRPAQTRRPAQRDDGAILDERRDVAAAVITLVAELHFHRFGKAAHHAEAEEEVLVVLQAYSGFVLFIRNVAGHTHLRRHDICHIDTGTVAPARE